MLRSILPRLFLTSRPSQTFLARHASVLTVLPTATNMDITTPPPAPSANPTPFADSASPFTASPMSPPPLDPFTASKGSRARVTLNELRQMLDTARGLVEQLERRHAAAAETEWAKLRREMEQFMEEQREAVARIEGAISEERKKGRKSGSGGNQGKE